MTSDNNILKQFGFENDEQMKRIFEEAGKLKISGQSSKEEAWQKLELSIKLKKTTSPAIKSFSIGNMMLAAASIAFILAAWVGFEHWNNKSISTGLRQMLAVNLPDGSQVTLNAASTLSWKSFGWKKVRTVHLEGEALFKVRKGNKFEVKNHNHCITVLGTEFNVYSRENYFEVKCFKGKVSVSVTGEKPIVIDRGNAIKREPDSKHSELYKLTVTDSASWINGEFYFNNTSLKYVFDEIQRQFNVQIQYTDKDRRYSGFFRNTSIDSALNNVCLPMGLKYNISGNSVIIK
jgi:transmembrane sensor